MKSLLLALTALFLCTFSGFAHDIIVVDLNKTYNFLLVDSRTITAKVVKRINANWIEIQYDNQTKLLNLQSVITIQDISNAKK